jgi:hypothetical protein
MLSVVSSNQSFFGDSAGIGCLGDSNSFFGTSSGVNAISASTNSLFGALSGLGLVGGSFNCFFGALAGGVIGNGGDNCGFGTQALWNSTANSNSAFGHLAGANLTSGGNNIILGANTNVSSPTASNELAIGNFITGNSIDVGIGGSRNLRIAGNLGVGNAVAATVPAAVIKKIEVFDASGASLGFIAVYNSIA